MISFRLVLFYSRLTLNDEEGSESLLNKVANGVSDQAYLTILGSFIKSE